MINGQISKLFLEYENTIKDEIEEAKEKWGLTGKIYSVSEPYYFYHDGYFNLEFYQDKKFLSIQETDYNKIMNAKNYTEAIKEANIIQAKLQKKYKQLISYMFEINEPSFDKNNIYIPYQDINRSYLFGLHFNLQYNRVYSFKYNKIKFKICYKTEKEIEIIKQDFLK